MAEPQKTTGGSSSKRRVRTGIIIAVIVVGVVGVGVGWLTFGRGSGGTSHEATRALSHPADGPVDGWTQYGGDGAHAAAGSPDVLTNQLAPTWTFGSPPLSLPADLRSRRTPHPSFGLPVARDGIVVAAAHDLFAVRDGKAIWRVAAPSDGGFFDPVLFHDDVISVALAGEGHLVVSAYGLADGEQHWSTEITATGARWAWITATDSTIFLTASPGPGSLWALDDSGAIAWQGPLQSHPDVGQIPSPMASDGRVVLVATPAGLEAYDALDGTFLWLTPRVAASANFTPSISGDVVVTGVFTDRGVVLKSLQLANGLPVPGSQAVEDIGGFVVVGDQAFVLKGPFGILRLPDLSLVEVQSAKGTLAPKPGFIPMGDQVLAFGTPAFARPIIPGLLDLKDGYLWTDPTFREHAAAATSLIGLAYDGDAVFVTMSDGRLIALERKVG